MGQYYRPLLWEGETGKGSADYRTFSPWGHGTGGKLTEHSWMGNYFVNAVLLELQNKPQHLIWVGDYSEGPEHDWVWGSDEDAVFGESELANYDEGRTGEWYLDGYVLNHTKLKFISFIGIRRDPELADNDGWVLNPVPILCANSNGLGGGDYFGQNKKLAGTWAGDLLEYVTERKDIPPRYNLFRPKFKE